MGREDRFWPLGDIGFFLASAKAVIELARVKLALKSISGGRATLGKRIAASVLAKHGAASRLRICCSPLTLLRELHCAIQSCTYLRRQSAGPVWRNKRLSTTFRDALVPLTKRMPRPLNNIEILRVASHLNGNDFISSASQGRAAALSWTNKRAGAALPQEAWNHQDFELLAGGRNSAAVRFQTETVDLWALRADDPDKYVAGRIWTTEIVIGGEVGKRPQLSLRLLVSTPEPELNIEPHVPGTVLQMISAPGLVRSGRPLRDLPVLLSLEDDAEDLCDHLEDPERRLPIIVVTLPDGEDQAPLVNDNAVAKATAGLARVIRLPAELTWVLTKRFTKQRSVFDGAVRVYLPGFSASDNPFRHRLFLASWLREPANAIACELWLRRLAADTSISSTRLGKDVVDYFAVLTASRRLRATQLKAQQAPDAELYVIAQELIDGLEKQLVEKDKEIEAYVGEVISAEERATAAEQENRSLLFKVRELKDALARGGHKPASDPDLPQEWSEFADWVDHSFPDRVVLTSAARRLVRKPEFEDVGQVARAVQWLATVQHVRRLSGGGSTRDETIEPGLINAYCGGDTYQTFWQGRRYDVDQHIKNGPTRDPRRCLRIYYFWEPDLQQTIIDHLPAHRDTDAT